jgi:DNA-binding FrmR family transcriptional regulator
MSKNPCHKTQLSRLNRIGGQVAAVGRMIEDGRYCVDIMTQIQAARAALTTVELDILKTHLGACVADAGSSKDTKKKDKKLEEVMNLLRKYM